MKYLKYTYIDCETLIPVSEAPAREGPIYPKGVSTVFAIEGTFSSGVPIFYGTSEDGFVPEDWMEEVSEDTFLYLYKQELKDRVAGRRKDAEQQGVEFVDRAIPVTPNNQTIVLSLCHGLSISPDVQEVILETDCGQRLQLAIEDALLLGQKMFLHSQKCLAWCKEMCDKVDTIESIEECHTFAKEIASTTN